VVWGAWSDHAGRKFAIRFLVLGWAATLLLMIFITSPTSAWIVLLAWGLFRNAPFPVVYALLIDSVPRAAGTAMGIMIGVALGVSGVLAAWVSGRIIDAAGFTAHYVVLAAICLLGLLPPAFITETVTKSATVEVQKLATCSRPAPSWSGWPPARSGRKAPSGSPPTAPCATATSPTTASWSTRRRPGSCASTPRPSSSPTAAPSTWTAR